ncbi:Vacuolar cation/proton exchanger 2, partial [Dionaea muscipula]
IQNRKDTESGEVLEGPNQMVPLKDQVDHESDDGIDSSLPNVTERFHRLVFEMSPGQKDVSNSTVLKKLKDSPFRSVYYVLKAKINFLLPFGFLAILLREKHGWAFFFSLLGIIPLAERLGYATEQLSFCTGPTVGGLLNATFGNATEMIIAIYALKHGMIRVVQQSLLGSILSNMLLAAALVNSGLLLMAVMGTSFPAVLHFTRTEKHFGKSELALSRFSSCIMLVAYASYLFFQLKSQNNPYSPVDSPVDNDMVRVEDPESLEKEDPEISRWEAIAWLSVLTLWVSFLSGYLVDAIEGASDAANMPVSFISVILLPIVGNATEHASAIMFAVKDKLDITIGVAIGSSTQISMFVVIFQIGFHDNN